MVDCILLAWSWCEARIASEKYKMNIYCPQWDSIPVLPAYQTDALSIVIWIKLVGKHLKVNYMHISYYNVFKQINQ